MQEMKSSSLEQDQLAKEGTYFNMAFVTTPICGASRATIMTGLYERKHKFTLVSTTLDSIYNRKNYAYELKKNGYKTGFFGKLGIKNNGGFTESFSDTRCMTEITISKITEDIIIKPLEKTLFTLLDILDKSLGFIENTQKDQPFCLSISFSAPHAHDGAWEGFKNNISGKKK